jgi:uncharacterized membrane protein
MDNRSCLAVRARPVGDLAGATFARHSATRPFVGWTAVAILVFALSTPGNAQACPSCTEEFRAALAEFGAYRPLAALASVAVVCAAAVTTAGRLFGATPALRSLLRAGLLLGIGLGGFVDGIVLHQILQWHAMVSAELTPADLISAKVNMVWDGVFHLGMWGFTLAGVATLWRAARHGPIVGEGGRLVAAMFLGWGLFNIIEGLIDHHIFGLHHVRDFVPSRTPWDLWFLGISAVLCGLSVGRALRGPRPPDGRT